MNTVGNRAHLSYCLFITLMFLTGCDQIQDLFSKKENSSPAPAAVSKNAGPVSTPPTSPAASPDTPLKDDELVKVGDWTMTIDDFNERLRDLEEVVPDFDAQNEDTKGLVLEELIRQQLFVWEARNQGLDKESRIVSAVEDFEKTLLVKEMVSRITEDIEATEADAREYYEMNKDQFVTPVEWHVREIIVYTQVTANEILAALLQGGNFAETAKNRSKSKSAAQGGDLGFIRDENIPFPEMRKILETLTVGQTSGVFKGPEGFYIVKLEEKKGGEAQPFADVKENLTRTLTFEKQQDAVIQNLNEIAAKTTIKVNEELLKN